MPDNHIDVLPPIGDPKSNKILPKLRLKKAHKSVKKLPKPEKPPSHQNVFKESYFAPNFGDRPQSGNGPAIVSAKSQRKASTK